VGHTAMESCPFKNRSCHFIRLHIYIRKVESLCEVCDRYQGKGMSTDHRHYILYFDLHIDELIGVCITTCVLCLHHYLPCHHAQCQNDCI
jgi:hypothetical protein